MGVYAGVEKTWASQTNVGRTHIATKGIVQSGLVLNLDAGASTSYPGSGTTWTDLSGNGNNGTLTNGPTYSSANGGSIVFDGSNDYVSSNVGTTLNIGTSVSVTLSAWIKYSTSAANYTGIISKSGSGASNTGFQMVLYTNKLSCEVAIAGNIFISPVLGLVGTTILNTGNWFNTVITIDRNTNTVNAYVNGVLESSKTSASVGTSNLTSAANLFIATERDRVLFLNGNISQVSIYNRALSSAEITQNFNALRGRFGI